MKTDEIKRRILSLEQLVELKTALCLVRYPDGSKGKVSVNEWYDHRHELEWLDLVSETDCSAPAFFIMHALTEDCIEKSLKAGKATDDPEILEMQAELDMYRRVLIGE